MKLDNYTICARSFPAILSGLPLMIIICFLSGYDQYKNFITYLSNLKFYGSITLAFIAIYALGLIISTYAKYLEKRYFHNKKGFPSTYFMLYGDKEFSADYKDKFRAKVKKLLGLDLLNQSDEQKDESEAIRRLNEATKQIGLKVDNGKLVKHQNVWYGFRRNMAAGSLFGFFISAISVLLGFYFLHSNPMTIVSFALLILYAMIFLMKGYIIKSSGEAYAKQLIAEFMMLT
jgi:hypothetical protein